MFSRLKILCIIKKKTILFLNNPSDELSFSKIRVLCPDYLSTVVSKLAERFQHIAICIFSRPNLFYDVFCRVNLLATNFQDSNQLQSDLPISSPLEYPWSWKNSRAFSRGDYAPHLEPFFLKDHDLN